MPVEIAVVADDLTGALDAVAPLAMAGLSCLVATGPEHLARILDAAEVVAVSTGSREMTEAGAVAVMMEVAAQLADAPMVFKKIDSRLKGHVGAESLALARARGLRRMLLCPAIPEMGRFVAAGRLYGHGVPVPIEIAACLPHGAEARIPDARSDTEIDALLADGRADMLLVGARGLSAGLARRMARRSRLLLPLPLPYPLAIAVGSRDAITLAQVAALRRDHPEAIYAAAPNGTWRGEARGDLAVLQAVPGDGALPPAEVADAFAVSFVDGMVPGRACLVLTGGETASAILRRMGIGVLRVLGEVLPGLVLCRALESPNGPLVLTKSGGFAAPEVFNQLLPPSPCLPSLTR